MTTREYLLANRQYLSLSAIGETAGISRSRFIRWVTDQPDGHGRASKLSADELARVEAITNQLRKGMEEFKPQNEEEWQFKEQYDDLSKRISEKIRGLPKEARLPILRDLAPTDAALMNLYLQAREKEDYETCAAAKELLLERGFEIRK